MRDRIVKVGYVPFPGHKYPHQQDWVSDMRGVSPAIVCGFHGNGAHFTKTMIVYENNGSSRPSEGLWSSQALQVGVPDTPRDGLEITAPCGHGV